MRAPFSFDQLPLMSFTIFVRKRNGSSTLFSECETFCAALGSLIFNTLKTTPVGFEPTRGDPIGLAGRRLNRSAKVSLLQAAMK